MLYECPLIWYGTWETPDGLKLAGFHLWDKLGRWAGVYRTATRAFAESKSVA
jgi:hypothetical protein